MQGLAIWKAYRDKRLEKFLETKQGGPKMIIKESCFTHNDGKLSWIGIIYIDFVDFLQKMSIIVD